jgi:hypothetical protein
MQTICMHARNGQVRPCTGIPVRPRDDALYVACLAGPWLPARTAEDRPLWPPLLEHLVPSIHTCVRSLECSHNQSSDLSRPPQRPEVVFFTFCITLFCLRPVKANSGTASHSTYLCRLDTFSRFCLIINIIAHAVRVWRRKESPHLNSEIANRCAIGPPYFEGLSYGTLVIYFFRRGLTFTPCIYRKVPYEADTAYY